MFPLKSPNNKWAASSWWCWFTRWKSVWWERYDDVSSGWTTRGTCKFAWAQHRCARSLVFLLSAANLEGGLEESWIGDGGLRNGFPAFSRLRSVFRRGHEVAGLMLPPAHHWPGGGKKQEALPVLGGLCVCVSVVRRKEQVKQQNVGDGSHLWIVERTWHDNCFCFSLAVGWWTSHFRFLSLIFLTYKIRVIAYLPGLLHINGPCGKQRPL